MKLTVNISAYLRASWSAEVLTPYFAFPHLRLLPGFSYRHWSIYVDHIALFNQQLPRFIAQLPHLVFRYRSACAQLCNRSRRGGVPVSYFCAIKPAGHIATGFCLRIPFLTCRDRSWCATGPRAGSTARCERVRWGRSRRSFRMSSGWLAN